MNTDSSITKKLAIEGMSCGHCIRAVQDALGQLPDVAVREVTLGGATIQVPGGADTQRIIRAIEEAGYSVRAT